MKFYSFGIQSFSSNKNSVQINVEPYKSQNICKLFPHDVHTVVRMIMNWCKRSCKNCPHIL